MYIVIYIIRAYIIHVHTYIHVHITCIHTYIYTCIHTCTCIYIYTYGTVFTATFWSLSIIEISADSITTEKLTMTGN